MLKRSQQSLRAVPNAHKTITRRPPAFRRVREGYLASPSRVPAAVSGALSSPFALRLCAACGSPLKRIHSGLEPFGKRAFDRIRCGLVSRLYNRPLLLAEARQDMVNQFAGTRRADPNADARRLLRVQVRQDILQAVMPSRRSFQAEPQATQAARHRLGVPGCPGALSYRSGR